jgi:hypothetical protein
MTGNQRRVGLKTPRDDHQLNSDSFTRTIQNVSLHSDPNQPHYFNKRLGHNKEIMTHNPRVQGLDNLSYGSDRFMKNTHSQGKLFGTIGGSDNTPIYQPQ